MAKLFLGTYETRNYDFMAVGNSTKEVLKLMRKGWYKHCEQTGACRSYYVAGDVNITEIEAGQVFRDFQLLVDKTERDTPPIVDES